MGAYERMVDKLKPLDLYKLDGTTAMDFELKAYGFIIDSLESKLMSSFTSIFYDEISMQNCNKLIELYKFPKSISLNDLKRILKIRMEITPTSFTTSDFHRIFEAGGFTATIDEMPEDNTICVTWKSGSILFADPFERYQFLLSVMPCDMTILAF